MAAVAAVAAASLESSSTSQQSTSVNNLNTSSHGLSAFLPIDNSQNNSSPTAAAAAAMSAAAMAAQHPLFIQTAYHPYQHLMAMASTQMAVELQRNLQQTTTGQNQRTLEELQVSL